MEHYTRTTAKSSDGEALGDGVGRLTLLSPARTPSGRYQGTLGANGTTSSSRIGSLIRARKRARLPMGRRRLTDRPSAVSACHSRTVRRISARRAVAETCLGPAACAGALASAPGSQGDSGGTGDRGGCGRRGAVLGSAASRGAKVVEDAANEAALGKEGDHRITPRQRGQTRGSRWPNRLGERVPASGHGRPQLTACADRTRSSRIRWCAGSTCTWSCR